MKRRTVTDQAMEVSLVLCQDAVPFFGGEKRVKIPMLTVATSTKGGQRRREEREKLWLLVGIK